ncbi:MAG: CrcB family protein [Methanoregulaceae archaeon]
MRYDPIPWIAIALGGFTGSILRFLVDERIVSLEGTLLVNTLGCFGMGLFMYEAMYLGRFGRTTRLFFAVGAIGSFTTFSALAVQTFSAGPAVGLFNIGSNVLFGLLGIAAGRHIILFQRGI